MIAIKIIFVVIFVIFLVWFNSWFWNDVVMDSADFSDIDFCMLLALLLLDVLFVFLGLIMYSLFFNGIPLSHSVSGHTTLHIIPIPHSDGTITPIPVGMILFDLPYLVMSVL